MILTQSDTSGQSIIVTDKNECEVYSKQKSLSTNSISLVEEHYPFLGVIISFVGVDDEKDVKVLLTCSNSDKMVAATTCEYNYCLLTQSGCPELVENPIFSFYSYLKIPLAILFMIIGLALLAFGFQFIRLTTVILAFLLGTAIYTIVLGESVLDEESSSFATLMIFCSGLGVGIIYANSIYVRYLLGLFNLGFAFGTLLALLMEPLFLHLVTPSPIFLVLSLTIVGSGIILGLLACKFVNFFGIGGTATIGAYLLIRPLGWLIGGYPNEIYLVKRAFYGFSKGIDYRFYLYFSSIFVLSIVSVFIQYRQHKKRMNMDEMFAYQDMKYYELENVGVSQVKGFGQEQELIEKQVQFMKSLSGKEMRNSESNSEKSQ